MDKHELWENFMKTGKVSDYLKYRNAKPLDTSGYDAEFADELYVGEPAPEEFNYDFDEDGWYGDTGADDR